MAYQTYITEALVCGSRASRTSDRSYLLFTRELGMLYATAQSVREERSKQRFGLQEFSLIRASLVRGKAGWRVAGVEPRQNLYAEHATREGRAFVRNTILLMRRLVRGEEAHPTLFDEVVDGMNSHTAAPYADRGTVLTLCVLHELGYIALDPETNTLLESETLEAASELLTDPLRAHIGMLVERALKESHL